MKRFLILIGAILLGLSVRAQSVTYTCRYWFDRDTEQVTTTFTGNTAQMELNVSTMTDGLHTLHVQVMDTAMAWCAPYSYYFIKIDDTPDEEKSYTYWFDRDYEGRQTGILGSGVLFIDVAGLRDGLHTLHLATIGSSMNNTYSYMIVKHPVLQPESQLEYRCWFDQNDSTLVTGPVGDGYCLVDVSALPIGDHYMNLQLADGTSLDILMGFGITRTPMVLVTAEPEAGGTATAVVDGDQCTVSATPNEGYDFTGWTHNSQVISTEPEMTFLLESDTAFVATFLLRSYDIVATSSLPAGGTVTGGGTYHHFDQCTLTATPRTGYNFLGWYSDDELFTTDQSFTFEVTGPAAFEARFEIQTFDITIVINPENGGTVTGAGVYNYGTQCTLTATPAEGYLFQGWMRNNTLVSDRLTYSFTANANADFVAQFYAMGPGIEGYVMDGLIMHVDGIQNTRDGHSTTTNVWEDLVGFHDLTVSNYSSYTWEDNHFMGNGNGGYLNTGKQWKYFNQINNDITIEIVTYIDCDRTYPDYRGLVGWHWGSDGWAIQNDQGAARMQTLNELPVTEADDHIATLSYTKGDGSFLNGEWKVNHNGSGCSVNSNYVAVFGNSWSYQRGWNDSIYAVRIYNRTLTREEVAQNHNVDAVRFGFAMYDITAVADSTQGTVSGAGEYRIHRPCTLTAIPNEGYCFKNWTEDGEVVSTEAEYTFIVESDRTLVANFLPLYDHTEALAEGWNWWSTYIEQDGIDGLGMLENSLGESGIRIQSRNDGYSEYIEAQGGNFWYGNLLQITNEQMYMIHTSADCEAVVTGPIAEVVNHPVCLSSGWNWVGYPVEQSIDLTNALSDLNPEANDVIKGRYGYSVYVVYGNNGFWYGTLNMLEPGKGYMYRSNSGDVKTFVYNVERGGNLVENVTAEGNTFQPADGDYAYNMTVTAVVDINGSELRNAGYELAAFVGDECRGSVRLIYVEPMDRYVAFLTVYGDTEETLDFVLTDGEGLSWSSDHIAYEANAIVGTPAAPAELHFGTLGVDETLGNVHVYPNPSNGVFNVNGVGVRKVEVVNAYGQIVYTLETKDDALRIDLSDMAAGNYLLRVVTDGGVTTRKLVKK